MIKHVHRRNASNLSSMTVRNRPVVDTLTTLTISPFLAVLTVLSIWTGMMLGAIVFGLALVQAFAGLNARPDSGFPLKQESLDRILDEVVDAVRTELYARDDNPLEDGGKLVIDLENVRRYQIPEVRGAVQILKQSHWIGVTPIAKRVFSRNATKYKIASTQRWLTNNRHEVLLAAPTAHERIEAKASLAAS